MIFADAWAQFYASTEGVNEESERYQKALAYQNHIGPFFASREIATLDEADTDDFYKVLRRKKKLRGVGPLGPKTIQNILGVLSAFLGWAWKRRKKTGMVDRLTIDQFRIRREPPDARKFADRHLEPGEVLRVRAAIGNDPPWALMFEIAIHTGMRIGEMLALKWSAVRLRDDDPRIIVKCAIGRGSPEVGAYEKSTKNRQERYLPISRELANTLRQAKRQGDYVCGDPQTGERINYSTAYRAMQRINERANVGKKIKWHMFRHTAASMMCQHGSIAEAQMLLGHQSAKALDPYRHFTATLGQTTMATLGKLFSTPDHPSTPNNGPTISRRVIPLKKAQPV